MDGYDVAGGCSFISGYFFTGIYLFTGGYFCFFLGLMRDVSGLKGICWRVVHCSFRSPVLPCNGVAAFPGSMRIASTRTPNSILRTLPLLCTVCNLPNSFGKLIKQIGRIVWARRRFGMVLNRKSVESHEFEAFDGSVVEVYMGYARSFGIDTLSSTANP
jgi:hypothetical protein